jgi:prepilin-type processing-associated H-X9-DG protein
MLRKLPERRAFTLVEFLVVFAIIVVLLLILWPVFTVHRDVPRVSCAAHLKQIDTALLMYLQDFDERLPPFASGSPAHPTALPALLHPYLQSGELWKCPKDERKDAVYDRTPGDTSVDYGYNWLALSPGGAGVLLKDVGDPVYTAGFVETSSYLAAPAPLCGGFGGSAPTDRHGQGVAVAWLDGHVKWMRRDLLDAAQDQESGAPLRMGIDAFPYWNLK